MLKPLKPSMKENKRYLYIEGKNLKENIENAILDFSGILGMKNVGLSFIQSNENNAIIAINRESVNLVRASVSIWPEKITVKRISGTLKGLKK